MQVLFLGGANEVGASCLALELAGSWIVVDAGVRMDRSADPLPDLALLEGKDIQAIFVTHAHADHIGALPVVHQAFPDALIYTSRATGLLMEVMLTDSLKIMERRAAEEMELPLYAKEMVASMLSQLRPFPLDTPFTLPELEQVTIQACRAGHIAGAVSLSFETLDGSIVVTGDISLTEQRTVLPAQTPPIEHPDLLVIESTYGTRLHANRQAEEARFAQAIAEGIARGGHVLIPAFGLGRGQEVLLILQDAIQKGQVPAFPIYVDGLIRRVCATYLLLPEALPPRLARQIRRGYPPFSNKLVRFVRDERERERILAGPPACIVSSSGMLTGGPSAWYAARLAAQASSSILITGYQDEESPGRRLLDVAENRTTKLEVDGKIVQVCCRVAKYSLSAHADSGELATYATALKPRAVALVHGDDEARAALRVRLVGTTVHLPQNGTAIQILRPSRKQKTQTANQGAQPPFPVGIGAGRTLSKDDLPELWRAVSLLPAFRVVTAREVAQIWYGEANDHITASVLDILRQDQHQRYFVAQQALEEAFRVQGRTEIALSTSVHDLVGQVLFLQVSQESAKPAFCHSLLPAAWVRVQLPAGERVRSRAPYSAILDVLGPPPSEIEEAQMGRYLSDLVRIARLLRKKISARKLALTCQEAAEYTLSDLCMQIDLSSTDLASRLAVAKIIQQAPRIFTLHRTVLDGDGQALYRLSPEWSEALNEPEIVEGIDQQDILRILERHLGNPDDLYRRSINPETGALTLAFYFPKVAAVRYADALAAAASESGVDIRLAEQPHQGMLTKAATVHLPQGLQARKAASLYHDRQMVSLECSGVVTQEEVAAAQERFRAETGWSLELSYPHVLAPSEKRPRSVSPVSSTSPRKQTSGAWGMFDALTYAQQYLAPLPGYLRVGVNAEQRTLILRFTFPDVARVRYAQAAAEIKAITGWHTQWQEEPNQGAVSQLAEALLPVGLTRADTISLYHDARHAYITCTGEADLHEVRAAQERFQEETGWQLTILGLAGNTLADESARPQLTQMQAITRAGELLCEASDLAQIGADEKRKVLWLHFYFPAVASRRYATMLEQIELETGWHVELRQNVHQRALLERALQLLPKEVAITGKKSVLHNEHVLRLLCHGRIATQDLAALQARFVQETGWMLDLIEINEA